MTAVQHDSDLPIPRPREALGLILPALHCRGCRECIRQRIYWDSDTAYLLCWRCTRALSNAWPERFRAVTVAARGLLAGVEPLSAAAAIALLVRHGGRVVT